LKNVYEKDFPALLLTIIEQKKFSEQKIKTNPRFLRDSNRDIFKT